MLDCVDSMMYIYDRRTNESLIEMNTILEDFLDFNESIDLASALHHFRTLRAYDQAQYRLQERERYLDHPTCCGGKPYRGSLFLTEARLSADGRDTEVLLSMAAGYLYEKLCETSSTVLKKRVPYRYVPGTHHGEVEGKYRRWDMRLDANGQDAIVEELERRIWAYEQERFDSLLTSWDTASRSCAYFVENPGTSDPRPYIVFSDKDALQRVRFRTFIQDCRSIEQPSCALEEAINEEKESLALFIATEHAEVIRTHDPKVVRLRERYRTAM
jgi:hypothetical protein